MEKKELELYIHIPFCVRKCNYCDFLSFPADEDTQRQYVKALCKEIFYYGAHCRDYVVSQLRLKTELRVQILPITGITTTFLGTLWKILHTKITS
jgi:hypothetical protein